MGDGLIPGAHQGYLGPEGDGQAIGVSTLGNTAGQTGTTQGTYVLAGSGGVTLSQSTSPGAVATVIISGVTAQSQSHQPAVDAIGVAGSGNFAGNTGVTITGTYALVGSGVVTLSQATAPGGGTVFINAAGGTGSGIGISANGSSQATGVVVLGDSNNVSFGMNGHTITAIAPINFSAGTTSGTRTAITFGDANGVSFGLNGSTITASIGSGATATGNFGGIQAVGGAITSGTASFSNANGVSFGIAGQTITANFSREPVLSANGGIISSGTASFVDANGVSFSINGQSISASIATSLTNINVSAGTTSNNLSAITFANGSGVSFGINASTITASVAAGATATGNLGAIAAGTQTATSGTIVFSNSGGVTFGLSGSTRVTATHDGVTAIRAGADLATASGNRIDFVNSNGVSWGTGAAASLITASIAAGATATGNLGGIADSAGHTVTNGTVVFSDGGTNTGSGNITFGLSGSTMTASHNAVVSVGAQDFGGGAGLNVGVPRWVWASSAGFNVAFSKSVNGVSGSIIAHAQAVAVADSAQTATSGTVQFSNSAIEFGLSGSSVMTAQPKRISYIVNNGYDRGVFLGDISVSTMWVAPFYVYAPISVTRCDFLCAISNGSSGGGSMVVRMGMYSLSQSTASLVFSAARSMSYNSTLGSNSSYTQISGTRYRSINIAAVNLTPGAYMMAFMYQLTTGQTSGTYQAFGGRDVSIVANEYPNALGTTNGAYWNGGFFSATTGAIPNSMHISDIVSTGSNDNVFVPFVTLAGTF